HTRWPRDWSSDVCSSDLAEFDKYGKETSALVFSGKKPTAQAQEQRLYERGLRREWGPLTVRGKWPDLELVGGAQPITYKAYGPRSEERRVGKERRSHRDA